MLSEGRIMALIFLAYTLLVLAAGAAIHWYLTKPDPVPRDTVAGQVVQADGSVVLTRVPVDKIPDPPAHQLPKGAVEERRVHVVIRPYAVPVQEKTSAAGEAELKPSECREVISAATCPPIHVDLSLIRDATGRRVVASSPDGDVIEGLDIPVESAVITVRHPKTEIGADYGGRGTYAVRVMHEFSVLGVPVLLGPAVINTPDSGAAVAVSFGIRF